MEILVTKHSVSLRGVRWVLMPRSRMAGNGMDTNSAGEMIPRRSIYIAYPSDLFGVSGPIQ